jgi:hypothetical protein
MIADPSFIDLDHLTRRLIVTHRLLLHYMKKPSVRKVRKILDVIDGRFLRPSLQLMGDDPFARDNPNASLTGVLP